MTTLIEYLHYPFFVRALIVGGMMSLILSWMGGYVVMRREVLFTDALSSIGFLGIALAILFDLPIIPMLIGTCLIGAYIIQKIQREQYFANDSLLEIFSRIAMALGIIAVAFFPGYRINIEQFLFGDILGISLFDFQMVFILLFLAGIMIFILHKNFLRISLSDTLSHTLVKKKRFYHVLLIFLLATSIAIAIKIIGALLVAAFTTIPSNSAKLFAKNLKWTFIWSMVIGFCATLTGLYLSILLNLPAGPLVVSVLGGLWIGGIFGRKFFMRIDKMG